MENNELLLRYGCTPHQTSARVFSRTGSLPKPGATERSTIHRAAWRICPKRFGHRSMQRIRHGHGNERDQIVPSLILRMQ
jgi:hypothetical protein